MTSEDDNRSKRATGGLPERDVPAAGRSTETSRGPVDDARASPLGRQGPEDPAGSPGTLSGGPSIAGRRGHASPTGSAGRAGELERENDDAMPSSRRGTSAMEGGKSSQSARENPEGAL